MKQHPYAIIRHQEGGILIEAALLMPIMVMIFLSMMEIAQFIDAKDRLNKITNQAAAVLSSITRVGQCQSCEVPGAIYLPPESIKMVKNINNAAKFASKPHGIKLSYQACGWPSDLTFAVDSGDDRFIARQGLCGFGTGTPDLNVVSDPCPTFSDVWYGYPTVSITASCNFYPIFSFGIFTKGIQIKSNNQAPMQFF